VPERRPTPKSKRTRRAILEAAERCFAELGFESTRLEDVAAAVGIRRASIVYYFRDKADLYESVLDELFGELLEAAQESLGRTATLDERVREGVILWVDYLASHPALARILLRDLPNTERGQSTIRRYTKVYNDLFEEQARGALTREAVAEQIQIGSVVTGATLFFIAATPALAPGFDPLKKANIERHKEHMLAFARQLIGSSAAELTSAPDDASQLH
jgi:TetR/AcrR family transcriptional regulator